MAKIDVGVDPAARDLAQILRGGYCTRWHANADLAHMRETLAEHHARVAQIILALHPAPSLALINAALHHDAGKAFVGDVPAPAKRANPARAWLLEQAEGAALSRLGVHADLTGRDVEWLALADRLAAFLHVAQVRPELLAHDDWAAERRSLLAMARALGWMRSLPASCPRRPGKHGNGGADRSGQIGRHAGAGAAGGGISPGRYAACGL